MTEKKSSSKTTTEKKASAKKAAAKSKASVKTTDKAPVLYINAENVGFKAGDVYQALASAGKSLTVEEIAKAANILKEEAYLGMGWLFKEGKIREEDGKITLA